MAAASDVEVEPPRPPKRAKSEEDSDASEEEKGGTEDASTQRPARAFEAMSFVRATSSDAYFLSNSHRRNFASRKLGRDLLRGTSAKKISDVLGPLDIAQLPRVAHEAGRDDPAPHPPARTVHSRLALALHLRPERQSLYISQLLSGAHLILYGVGDRMPILRTVLEGAAAKHAGAAVLVQGAAGRALNVDRVLDAMEAALLVDTPCTPPLVVPPLPSLTRPSRTANRIRTLLFQLAHASHHDLATHPQRLFVGLAAFDNALLHTSKLHTLLHALARSPHVHILASVSHLQAGLVLDGAAGAFSYGISSHAEERARDVPERDVRPAWLWHHCTTYIPSVTEMLHSRGATMSSSTSAAASYSGLATLKLPAALDLAGRGARMVSAPGQAAGAPISQKAALQVLNTITARARTLFTQLALLQLVAMEDALPEDEGLVRIPYPALVRDAIQEFTASSDDGVKQLLGEMVDHGLVLIFRGTVLITSSHAIATGDTLHIPLGPRALETVLANVDT